MNSIELIEKYFPQLTEQQKQQFTQLGELYHHWNAQINLISRTDMDNLYEKHILQGLTRAIRFSGSQINWFLQRT